jgi:hypothetical protein
MSVFGASVQTTNFKIMSLLTSNTASGITTYIECFSDTNTKAADAELSSRHVH